MKYIAQGFLIVSFAMSIISLWGPEPDFSQAAFYMVECIFWFLVYRYVTEDKD